MGDIVNLNRARKSRARADKERQAAANRVEFGRTKAEKSATAKEKSIDDRRHEGSRLTQREDKE